MDLTGILILVAGHRNAGAKEHAVVSELSRMAGDPVDRDRIAGDTFPLIYHQLRFSGC